ncbi:hypothetical protein Rhal01_03548 [Rubritalea halochordaticola]|uniref:Uncharacterized protein n=1 Tax=Rubritalea halochordaticola TaxID=714537 RepID=A0ABP9V3V8_9BACT
MFKALLATGRISNLPTVWSNVLVAFVIIFGLNPERKDLVTVTHTLDMWLPLLITCIAASLLYVGGCFLGDAIDAKFDEQHKPDRPIPSGVLSRKGVFTGAIAMLALGSVIPFIITHGLIPAEKRPDSWLHLLAIPLLVAAIVLYSWLHKKTPWYGLPLIGACRFCLVVFGGAMAASCIYQEASFIPNSGWAPLSEMLNGILVTFAATVAAYTICFASVARSESSPKPITWRKVLIPTMLILPLWMLIPAMFESDFWEKLPQAAELLLYVDTFPIILVALANYLIWNTCSFIKLKSNKGAFVSMSLAGFCLLDAFFIALSGWQNFFIVLGLFLLALLLQRWAPAT